MNTAAFILVIFASSTNYNNPTNSVAVAEFTSEQRCLAAAKAVESMPNKQQRLDVKVACVQK